MKTVSYRPGIPEIILRIVDIRIVHIANEEKNLIALFLWNTAEIVTGDFFSAARKNINNITRNPVHDNEGIFESG